MSINTTILRIKGQYNRVLLELSRVKYLNRWVVFLTDLLLSVFSTLGVCLVVSYVLEWEFVFRYIYYIVTYSSFATVVAMLVLKSYANVIRYTTLRDVWRVLLMGIFKEVVLALGLIFSGPIVQYRIIFFACTDFFLTFAILLTSRILILNLYNVLIRSIYSKKKRILIYGIGNDSVALAQGNSNIYMKDYVVQGFFMMESRKETRRILGHAVYCARDEDELSNLVISKNIDSILFPTMQSVQKERSGLVSICERLQIRTLVVPNIEEMKEGIVHRSIRPINVEDLLGRDEIKINLTSIGKALSGKVILVTGAAGSIGSEICRQLAKFQIQNLICFDSAETPMHNLRLQLEATYQNLHFVAVIGDVRSRDRLEFVFSSYSPQVVFHAAAYKHVPLMEENPCEAVRVNVFGTRNIADISVKYGVERFVMISTDKAVNPTNIMGCSKRIAEIYVQSLNLAIRRGEIKGMTKFITTRFGNVLGSNGSVIPLFKEQIENGGPVTVTHPDIIRFFMTIPEACRLVLEAGTMGEGGEIFVFDMGEAVKIVDLARHMIELAGFKPGKDISIVFTGLRPGEKLYEEVLGDKENTKETPHEKIRVASVREYDYFLQVLPSIKILSRLSAEVKIEDMVKVMKNLVAEFKSRNSIYEMYDKN